MNVVEWFGCTLIYGNVHKMKGFEKSCGKHPLVPFPLKP